MTHANKTALRIEGLVKDYGSIRAVAGIDLEMRRGEVFGFLGSNGAGKTTQFAASSICFARRPGGLRCWGLTRSVTGNERESASPSHQQSCVCPSARRLES